MQNLRTGTLIAVLALLGVFASNCGSPIDAGSDLDVIYGTDDRKEVFQYSASSQERAWWDSTVALVKSSSITAEGSFSRLRTQTFGNAYNLCPTEPYREQPNPAFCSGFLISGDQVATAGHCIKTVSDCANTKFVFGFAYSASSQDVTKIENENVYGCAEVIHSQAEGSGADFAVVKLDRPVTGHQPVTFRREGSANIGQSLTLIGHPAGLPAKIAPNAKVRRVQGDKFLVANTDSYGGNSGSAVFNSESGVVEGILVRGEQDFKSQGTCTVSYVCTESGCRGEDVTLAAQLTPFVDEPTTPPSTSGEVLFSDDQISLSIPDNNKSGIEYGFNVTKNLDLTDFTVDLEISHTYIGDLAVSLVHPSGRSVLLHNRIGGNQRDIVKNYNYDNTPSLKALQGLSAKGNWRLKVQDLASRDIGVLQKIRLIQKEDQDSENGSLETQTYTENNLNLEIPDNDALGVQKAIDVSLNGKIKNLIFELKVKHSYIGDLRVTLISPDAKEYVLQNRNGGSQDDLNKTWDLESPQLSELIDKNPFGEWTLKVTDVAAYDLGSISSYALTITTYSDSE